MAPPRTLSASTTSDGNDGRTFGSGPMVSSSIVRDFVEILLHSSGSTASKTQVLRWSTDSLLLISVE
jgi:hypothetical protein